MQSDNRDIWWNSDTCDPYRVDIEVPLNPDGGKSYPIAHLDNAEFWRCNFSYELGLMRDLRQQNQELVGQNTVLTDDVNNYESGLESLGVVLFCALALGIISCLLGWKIAHERRIRSFQAHHLDRLARESHTYNRDSVAQIRASIERELEESKHLFPYVLGIREQYRPTLAETAQTASEVQKAVNAYLEPRSQVELDEKRMELELRKRGEEIKQDLQAEVPRFVREQLRRQHQAEQNRWQATTNEVTELRKTLVATVTELRENPALQTKLGAVVDAVTNLSEMMDRLRREGRIEDDLVGEYLDRLVTKVTEDHIAKNTGSSFNAN